MSWSLATTQPNVERIVCEKLIDAGIQFQVFFIKSVQVIRGKIFDRLRPAFPRYLFVQAEGRWRDILDVHGIIGFVNHEGYPAIVDNHVVDSIAARCTSINGKLVLDAPPRRCKFRFGDHVQIINSSYISGRRGMFQSASGASHCTVLIEAMGRYIPFCVDEGDLITVGKRRNSGRWQKRRSA